ncbi:C40 family peptidase [Neisseria chenwenguii]|uniref:Uncharacterized protein n=1 Tax=Neisseria chenwenguii TaxID=1853278 RepID=A0A220S1A7_9NEIS|nr:C40 family peptidase [Neisseria chenwenguii]ASK27193.1 hypothetical protein BG910_05065 [Neisseria chenwenguii]ROV54895.1 peptidoglycan endopeptidase [Neisseria chenwenguii]
MKCFKQLTAAWAAAFLLLTAGANARADDLETLVTTRQQILNQFGSNSSPAARTVVPSAPAAPAISRPTAPAASYIPTNSAQGARAAGSTNDLIRSAMGLLGIAYRYGGTSVRTGFDCSGFMQHIFRRSLGVNLPRTSAQQAKMGYHINRSELQAGDMVFFRTRGRGRISHVGLYIGNNRFIHAPRTGKRIEITSLGNRYWNAKYAFARRVKRNDPSRYLN